MHYKNGREAIVGDRVIGRTYNQKDVVVGTLLSITPGAASCNCMVGYIKVRELPITPGGLQVVKVMGTENHGFSGKWSALVYEEDYTQCDHLLNAEDAAELSDIK